MRGVDHGVVGTNWGQLGTLYLSLSTGWFQESSPGCPAVSYVDGMERHDNNDAAGRSGGALRWHSARGAQSGCVLSKQERMGTQGFSLVVCRPETTMLGSPESSREGRAGA